MKKLLSMLAVVALAGLTQAQTLTDGWYYTGVADNVLINTAGCGSVSNSTAYWKHNGTPVVASNEMQRWEGDYVAGVNENGSAFKNINPSSSANALGGTFELSYDVVDADFTTTAASNGSANVMYIMRGKSGNNNYDCGIRFRYEGGLDVTNIYNGVTNVYADADQFDIMVRSDDLGNWTTVETIAGHTISDVHLRMVYDIDAKTNGAYISVGGGSETLIHSGTMQSDWTLAEIRQGFQSGNGGQAWYPGDVVTVDNIELFKLEAAPPPPALALVDLWEFEGLTNGAGLSEAESTGLIGGTTFSDATPASITNLVDGGVTNGALRFTSNEYLPGSPEGGAGGESLFRTASPSLYGGSVTGVFEVAYDILSIDFTETSLVSSNGQFGFEVRDSSNKRMGLHIAYNGSADEITVEFEDADGKVDGLVIPGHVVENLNLRMLMDLDQAGSVGSAQFFYTYNGVEVGKYDGTVHSGFDLAQYRLRCQPINGGNGWKIGDVSLIDNLRIEKVTALETEPVYSDKVVYEMNDTAGTLLSALAQTGSDGGQFLGTDSFIATDGSGSLAFSGVTESVTRKHFLDVAYTSGVHRIEFAFNDWDLDATADGSFVKFGLVDASGTNQVQFGIDVNTNNATVRFRAAANNGGEAGQDFYDYTGYVSSTGVVLRIDVNVDAGIYSAFWRYDNQTDADFIAVVGGGSVGQLADIAEIRLSLTDNGFDPADYIKVDYLRYSTTSLQVPPTPAEFYAAWLGLYPGLGVSTNLGDNTDGDVYDNLTEYYYGGNPTVGEAIANVPAVGDQVSDGGTNYILYVFTRRQDAADRGLSNEIQLNDNLVYGTWTNNASLYQYVGAENIDDTWRSITNRVNAEAGARFIRNRIQFVP